MPTIGLLKHKIFAHTKIFIYPTESRFNIFFQRNFSTSIALVRVFDLVADVDSGSGEVSVDAGFPTILLLGVDVVLPVADFALPEKPEHHPVHFRNSVRETFGSVLAVIVDVQELAEGLHLVVGQGVAEKPEQKLSIVSKVRS